MEKEQSIANIAKRILQIEDLSPTCGPGFRDLHISNIKMALMEAYEAGERAGRDKAQADFVAAEQKEGHVVIGETGRRVYANY